MLKLENVQSTICGIVKTAESLKNFRYPQGDAIDAHVFADDGTMREQIEESLKQKGVGWAIVVSPPVGASAKDQIAATSSSAGGYGAYNVLTNIAVRTNPKINSGDNAIVLLTAVKQIIMAAVGWQPAPGEKGFTLNNELPFSPDFADEGCFTYDIKLMKTVALI